MLCVVCPEGYTSKPTECLCTDGGGGENNYTNYDEISPNSHHTSHLEGEGEGEEEGGGGENNYNNYDEISPNSHHNSQKWRERSAVPPNLQAPNLADSLHIGVQRDPLQVPHQGKGRRPVPQEGAKVRVGR